MGIPKKVFENCFPSRKKRFSREFKISRRSQYRDEHIGETTCFKVTEKISFSREMNYQVLSKPDTILKTFFAFLIFTSSHIHGLDNFPTRKEFCYFLDLTTKQDKILSEQLDLMKKAIEAVLLCENIPIQDLPILSKRGTRLIQKEGNPFGVIKERKKDNFKECLMWNISQLLGLERFVAPSCLITVQGQKVIFQPFIPLCTQRPKLSLKEYWFACLTSIIFGACDYYDKNLGFTQNNSILFFDNEEILFDHNSYFGCIEDGNVSFKVPFINFMVDWEEGMQLLDSTPRLDIIKEVDHWIEKWPAIDNYLHHPQTPYKLDESSILAIKQRLLKMRAFFKEDLPPTMQALTTYLFPNYTLGINDLKEKVAPIINLPPEKVGNMICFIFLSNWRHWWRTITPDQKQSLEDWIEEFYLSKKSINR